MSIRAKVLSEIWARAAAGAVPLLRLMLWLRARDGKEIVARLPERRGIDGTPRPPGHLIWLHAASVGETASILPVLAALAAEAPDLAILITTGTVTSWQLLDQRLGAMGLAGRVTHRFAPLDVPAWVGRFLDHWRPDAAVFVESELWPNTLAGCRRRQIPLMLVNARMSARSFATWSRVPWAARAVLGLFTAVLARSEEDASRLRDLGAPAVETLGDLKLAAPDLPADPVILADLKARLAGRPVFLAASTHPGEEVLIKEAHDQLAPGHPGLVTIIVPRHPDRGAELAALFNAPRRDEGPPASGGVWIADSLGELGFWYRLSDVTFIGRSLLPPGGGQNPLEPARLACAIATGPQTSNFTEHVTRLRAADGLEVAPDIGALVRFVDKMLSDPRTRRAMGARAKAAAAAPDGIILATARRALALMEGEDRAYPNRCAELVTPLS